MASVPYARILMSVNSGAYSAGARLVPSGATLAFKGESVAGWNNGVAWEIFGVPPNNDQTDWAGPGDPDWVYDDVAKVWRSTSITPASFTLPADTTTWGKWLLRLVVNNGVDPNTGVGKRYDPAGNLLPNQVIDISGGWEVISPFSGLTDVSPQEGTQFNLLSYIRELQYTLRTIDMAIGSSGGTVAMGGDVIGPSSNATVVRLRNVPLDSSMATPSDGDVMQYDAGSTSWKTASLGGLLSLAGDVNGSLGANHVDTLTGPGTGVVTIASGTDLHIVEASTSFDLSYNARTSDAATGALTIRGQYAYASATGTNRLPGAVVFDIGAPTNGATDEQYFQWTRDGSPISRLGCYPGVPSQVYFWLGSSPTLANPIIGGDGSTFAYLNAPTLGAAGIIAGNSTILLYFPALAGIARFGGAFVSNAPLNIDWSAGTDVSILSGQAIDTLTVGTMKSGAGLIFSADNSTPLMELRLETLSIGDTSASTSPIVIEWSTSTAPSIASGNNADFLVVGTTKSGAKLVLNGGAGTEIVDIADARVDLVNGAVMTVDGSIQLGSSPEWGGGSYVLGIVDAAVVPTTNPAGGGILYSESGAGKWRGSSGTVTTFGPADLAGFKGHCPSCGTDFAHEWQNDEYGGLTVCMKCLTDEIGERPWIVRKAA